MKNIMKSLTKDPAKDLTKNPAKPPAKRRRKVYRFTLDPAYHRDLIGFMESVPKVLRGGYCVEALKLLKEKMSISSDKTSKNIDFGKLLK